MNGPAMLGRIRVAVQQESYRLSNHAERERDADRITNAEIGEAFGHGQVEILEDYPNDPRGHSLLILGFTHSGSPIHAVMGFSGTHAVLVTIYRPDPVSWYDWRRRV